MKITIEQLEFPLRVKKKTTKVLKHQNYILNLQIERVLSFYSCLIKAVIKKYILFLREYILKTKHI